MCASVKSALRASSVDTSSADDKSADCAKKPVSLSSAPSAADRVAPLRFDEHHLEVLALEHHERCGGAAHSSTS